MVRRWTEMFTFFYAQDLLQQRRKGLDVASHKFLDIDWVRNNIKLADQRAKLVKKTCEAIFSWQIRNFSWQIGANQ